MSLVLLITIGVLPIAHAWDLPQEPATISLLQFSIAHYQATLAQIVHLLDSTGASLHSLALLLLKALAPSLFHIALIALSHPRTILHALLVLPHILGVLQIPSVWLHHKAAIILLCCQLIALLQVITLAHYVLLLITGANQTIHACRLLTHPAQISFSILLAAP